VARNRGRWLRERRAESEPPTLRAVPG
jgi:hypothetical protein